MTLLVRDEEDILPANIEFHLRQGIEYIIATDNRSCDKTSEILRHYEQQGILRYIYEASDDYNQYRWVSRMARLAFSDHGADWVINNDADEFWWPERGGCLKDILACVPPEVKALSAERVNFIPRAEHQGMPFYDAMLIREAKSLNAAGRPLPPKVCHRGSPDIEVAQGNHSVAIPGESVSAEPSNIRIFHFPLRSYRQFENKIAKGGRAYENNKELPKAVGGTWRKLFALYNEGNLRAYYSGQVLSDGAVQRGLADGSLVEDRRLSEYFHESAGTADKQAKCFSTTRWLSVAWRWLQRRR